MALSGRHLLLAVCLVVLGLLLWRSPPKPLTEFFDDTASAPQYPTTYLTKATTRQFDDTGKLHFEIFADAITQYDSTTTDYNALFTEPRLSLYDDDGSPWKIQSKTATVANADDEFLLTGAVVIYRENAATAIQLTTEELRVKPNSQYADTDKPVMITDANGTITTTGIKIFFEQQRIELLSNVRSTLSLN